MGAFSALDAMFAPVASRFGSYAVALESEAEAYAEAVTAHPFMAEWRDAAIKEPWIIAEFEYDDGEE
jgi:glutathione S-transferase